MKHATTDSTSDNSATARLEATVRVAFGPAHHFRAVGGLAGRGRDRSSRSGGGGPRGGHRWRLAHRNAGARCTR